MPTFKILAVFLFSTVHSFSTLELHRLAYTSFDWRYRAGSQLQRTASLFSSAAVMHDTSPSDSYSSEDLVKDADITIVGAGPAGLLSAVMLARKFPHKKLNVFDRLSPPPSPTDKAIWSDIAKFYLIGLGARGQRALEKYGAWDDVKRVCIPVVGRMDWSPGSKEDEGVQRIFTDRPVDTQVLPRDKLVGALHKHIVDNYSSQISLKYGYEVIPINFAANNNTCVSIRISKCTEDVTRMNPSSVGSSAGQLDTDVFCDVDESFIAQTNLLIAADGTSRTVANAMELCDKDRLKDMLPIQRLFADKPFRIHRYEDDNQRVYKTVPIKLPCGWRADLNYSARTKDGRVNFDALPADSDGNYCGVLLLRGSDNLAKENTNPSDLRSLLNDALPQFSKLLDDPTVETIAKKAPSFLPSFRFAGPRLHHGDFTVILGDCAHTVKPYFGLGANSALEDVKMLEEAIDKTASISEAVRHYSRKRAPESEALVKISRQLDRPGILGAFTFIIPLIMDSIFHKKFPKVFAPNTIAMLQKEGISFVGVQRRKNLDRLAQVSILSSGIYGVYVAARWLIHTVNKDIFNKSAAIAVLSYLVAVTYYKLKRAD